MCPRESKDIQFTTQTNIRVTDFIEFLPAHLIGQVLVDPVDQLGFLLGDEVLSVVDLGAWVDRLILAAYALQEGRACPHIESTIGLPPSVTYGAPLGL